MLILIQGTTPLAALRKAPCLILQGILGGLDQGSPPWLLDSWVIFMSPVLGRCVNLLAVSCSWQSSTSQFLAQPSQHFKEYGIYCLSTVPVFQERKSIIFYKSKLTSACEHKKIKKAFYPGKWKKVENLHFLFLCFSVSFRLDIKTHCSIWGESAVKNWVKNILESTCL